MQCIYLGLALLLMSKDFNNTCFKWRRNIIPIWSSSRTVSSFPFNNWKQKMPQCFHLITLTSYTLHSAYTSGMALLSTSTDRKALCMSLNPFLTLKCMSLSTINRAILILNKMYSTLNSEWSCKVTNRHDSEACFLQILETHGLAKIALTIKWWVLQNL